MSEHVQIGSLEMVLLWEALRKLAKRTTDDVKRRDCVALLRKLRAKEAK